MILAAGRGERMLPLTRDLPKPLLPVDGTTLIQRHLKHLAESGIERVVINVHHFADKIIDVLGDAQFGMPISYSREEELLETAGGIQAALPLLGDEPFLIVNGDVYTDFPFHTLLDVGDKLPHLVMIPNPEHHPNGDFALEADGVLKNEGAECFTYSGIGVYQARFFAHVAPGKLKLRALFDAAVSQKSLYGELYTGFWSDIGTPERYKQLIARSQ